MKHLKTIIPLLHVRRQAIKEIQTATLHCDQLRCYRTFSSGIFLWVLIFILILVGTCQLSNACISLPVQFSYTKSFQFQFRPIIFVHNHESNTSHTRCHNVYLT